MTKKLTFAQKLLDGLAKEDFGVIERNAQYLLDLSNKAEWKTNKSPAYESHSLAFRRSCETMIECSKRRNLDGATLAYMEMTMSCVKCHKYTRETRVTRLDSFK